MSVAVAMLFLIEATTACGPVTPPLGGGAEAVRAILDVEDQASDPPVVTPTGLSQSTNAASGDPKLETKDPHSDRVPAECKPAPVPIA